MLQNTLHGAQKVHMPNKVKLPCLYSAVVNFKVPIFYFTYLEVRGDFAIPTVAFIPQNGKHFENSISKPYNLL